MATHIGGSPKTLWTQATRTLQSLATAPTRAVRSLAQMKGVALMKARAANQALGQHWHQTAARPAAAPPAVSGSLTRDEALRRAARQRIRLEGVKPNDLPPAMQAAYLRGQQAQTPARFAQNTRRALAEHQADLSALHPAQQRLLLSQVQQRSTQASGQLARGHAQAAAAQNAGQLEEDRLKGQAVVDFRTTARVATMGASESAIAARQAAGEGRWLAAAGQGLKGAVQTAMAATSAPGLGLLARGGLGLARAGVGGVLAVVKNPALAMRAAQGGLRTAGTALPQIPGLVARAPGAAWNAVSQAPAALVATSSNTWNAGRAALATGVTGTQVVSGMAIAGNTVDTGLSAGRALSKGAAGNWSGALVDGLAVTLAVVPGMRGAAAEARAARGEALQGAGVNRMMGDNLSDYLTAAQAAAPGGATAATLSATEALAQQRQRLTARIERACASSNKGVKLEGEAAKAIRPDVTGFQKKVVDPITGQTGEIDIETRHALVEVTTDTGGKADQLKDKYLNPAINTESKPVVLYAPRYTKNAEQHLQSEGFFEQGLAAVVKTEEQLQRAIDVIHAYRR